MATATPSMLSLLTEDLLARILDALEADADRKAWRVVCTDFLRVDSLRRSTLRVLRPEFLPGLLQKLRNVSVLDLSLCPRIDDVAVAGFLSLAGDSVGWTRRVRELVLSRATGLRSTGLGLLVRSCPFLEAVDLSYCWAFGDREAAALSRAEGLRALKLDKCLGLTDVGLAKIVIGCSKLETLSLKWCLEISDLGLDLLSKKCLNLKSLDISYLKVTNESLCSIASLQKLEVLSMVGCSWVNNVGLQFLGDGCPSLQVLDIMRCEGVDISGIASIIRGHSSLVQLSVGYCCPVLRASLLHWVKNLKDLNSIRLDMALVSDSNLSAISSNCRGLVEIGLSKCTGVTDSGIMQLVFGCVNLKAIDLTCCHSITDVAISAIARSSRHLISLKLESCNLITEKSLDSLGSFCQQLEELDLTDCRGVNDTGLNYLSRCLELLCLKLGLCEHVSDKGLSYIADNCIKLHDLDLYRCAGIGDDGLHALSRGCKKLKKLNLSYCNEITDIGMEHLSNLQQLSDLELRGIVNITSAGLAAVVAGCKSLAELDLKLCRNINDSGFQALAYYSKNLRQINLSYCAISDMGLCIVMRSLLCLQDVKLVHLDKVSVEGLEFVLTACSARLKKVKLLSLLKYLLSPEILETLQAGGCKLRWD